MKSEAGLIAEWKAEGQAPFAGWDFSHLDGRMLEDQAPWSYSTRAAELMRGAALLVDLGTGGGTCSRCSVPRDAVVQFARYAQRRHGILAEPNIRLRTRGFQTETPRQQPGRLYEL